MHARARSAILIALVFVLALAAGCGGGETPARKEGKSKRGGTLVIGVDNDADALSPLTSTTTTGSDIHGLLFGALARTNPDMASYSPWLARSWEFSSDHRSLTFFLRDDVLWHDGVRFSAEDVVFSVPLYRDEKIAYGSIRWLDHIIDVVALDSFTVRFDFDAVYPYQLTDANVGRPLPKHILEGVTPEEMRNHPFNRNPVGTGPFRFGGWKTQQSITILANEEYFLGRPPLDRVVFKIVSDETSFLTQIKTGEIDFYPKLPPNAYEELLSVEHLEVLRVPSRVYYYLGWQGENELFRDRDVRRALTMAVDREKIVATLLHGCGRVIHGPILPFLWAHDPDVPAIPCDPEGAKKLLAEAGWEDHDGDGWLDKDGRPFEFTMKANENNELRKDILVIVQEMLARIGVRMHPLTLEFTVFIEQTNRKEFEADCHGWRQGVKVDLTSIWHSRSIGDKYNQVSYSNPEVDRLIDEASLELDRERAKKLWSEVQRAIAADAPYTFLFNLDDLYAIDKRFKNVRIETYAWTYNLDEWYEAGERRDVPATGAREETIDEEGALEPDKPLDAKERAAPDVGKTAGGDE
ncbi:MAG: peptide-binding protein [Candidatus Eisenbacteria bacterium]